MEPRKQKEIEYYNRKAERWLKDNSAINLESDFEGFNSLVLSSYKFCYNWLAEHCKNKTVLDYGCGNGIHSIFPAKVGADEVIGIDLSVKSLEIAKEKARKEGVEGTVKFLNMDCEEMEFPADSFDIIFDGGTFSSLNLKKVFPELSKVLKPKGFLIGIETLGHNPLTNLKRELNKLIGKRTEWAVAHILKVRDLEEAKKYFNKVETKFFHLISWLAFPFLKFPGGKLLLKLLEQVDGILLKIPFLRKYAFKVVFVFSEPRKK